MPDAPLAGLVLCGGASRRMKTEKALLDVGGQSLLRRVAERLATVAAPVMVAPGTPGRLGPLPWPEVADPPEVGPLAGPVAGIVAGLVASPHPWMAVVAVDLPMVSPELLRWLHDQRGDEPALVPVDPAGRPQPLHAVYAAGAAGLLLAGLRSGGNRVLDLLEPLDVRLVVPPPPHDRGTWALNLNRPGDLAALSSPRRGTPRSARKVVVPEHRATTPIPDASDADLAEQAVPVEPPTGAPGPAPASDDPEAPEADLLEQAQEVPLEDDERR